MVTTSDRLDLVGDRTSFAVPEHGELQEIQGRGPFVSGLTWRRPDGAVATWDSRRARKRGYVELLVDGVVQRIRARPAVAIRLGRVNAVAGVSFAVGGALFAIGALLAQLSSATSMTLDLTFLCGGVFFCSAVTPRSCRTSMRPAARRRTGSWCPGSGGDGGPTNRIRPGLGVGLHALRWARSLLR